MRIVFLGSGAFAVPSLEALRAAGHDIVTVVSQPDRSKGRGRQIGAPPVKTAAASLGLRVFQPDRARDASTLAALAPLAADLQVVVAYGQILPASLIQLAPLGTVNLHASLLPRYRGAAPIQWALARGESETGVTTMLIDEGLDTGPLLLAAKTEIEPDETAGHLEARLSAMGAHLLVETVARLGRGEIAAVPQNNALATYAPLLRKEEGQIAWHLPATETACRIRAFTPWPGAHTRLAERSIKVLRARPAVGVSSPYPGEILSTDRSCLVVACGERSALCILELQPESRKPMDAAAFVAGSRVTPGMRFQ